MAKVAYRLILLTVIALVILANASRAIAGTSPCPKINEKSDYEISSAVKLAWYIQDGVSGLAADYSGDHPTKPVIDALNQFNTDVDTFKSKNKDFATQGHYEFDPGDCTLKPQNSLAKDGCDYCPKLIDNTECDPGYYDTVLADVKVLAYGGGDSTGKFKTITIKPMEGVFCIALNLNQNPTSARAMAATKLEASLETLLQTSNAPLSVRRFLWGVPTHPKSSS